jgi:hypothetical protein
MVNVNLHFMLSFLTSRPRSLARAFFCICPPR